MDYVKESLNALADRRPFYTPVSGLRLILIGKEKIENDESARILVQWQAEGLVPDMPIERRDIILINLYVTRGWTYWHHLFHARTRYACNLVLIGQALQGA